MALTAEKTRKNSRVWFDRIFWQEFLYMILMCTLVLLVTLVISLNFSIQSAVEKLENTISSVANSLSDSDMIQNALTEGACPPELIAYLDDLLKETEDLEIITIADCNSLRIYHVNHDRIGEYFVGGDQDRVLKGERYLSDAVGTMGLQHRAFSPVISNGEVIGFVIASTTMNKIDQMRTQLIFYYLQIFLFLLLGSYAIAGAFTMLIRQAFQGYEPEALLHTFFMQESVLETLDEGIVSTDLSGKILLANKAAARMLENEKENLEEQPLGSFLLTSSGERLPVSNVKNLPTSKPNILYSSISVMKNNKPYGAVYIFTDKTEAMRSAEQLTGSMHIISTLRANSHEYMNKLQVISGLLQMNQTDQALHYISGVSAVHAEAIGPILQYIRNQSVAALLLGKLSHMKERNIHMTLLPGSALPVHSQYLSSSDLVTIIGNLLENAIEAINARMDNGPRTIDLQITENESGLLLLITDTGIGIPHENLSRLYEQGFSTKATHGRGVGMTLVYDAVTRNKGTIELESELGNGTTFTIVCTKLRNEGGTT